MPDSLDGNESQARKMARQLFAIWTEEQESKAKKPSYGALPAWTACVLSVGALIWNAAIITGDVNDTRRRVETLEVKQDQTVADRGQVIDRLARIEAKLDLMGDGQ